MILNKMDLLNIFSKKRSREEKKERIKIEIDFREKNSLVPSELMRLGFEIDFKQLNVGDYIVRGVVIERKTISDFKSSIINKRIITQLLELKQFDKNLLILEGVNEEMYLGGIHENAFRGFLLSVAFDYRIPVIFAQNERDTAKYISILSKKGNKEISFRASKTFLSEREQQQFILEGFPNIGPKKARKLLEKFGNLREIINANEEKLREILGKRAEEFRKLVEMKY